MKRFNLKLVVILSASMILFFGGVYALHGFQMSRTASTLQEEAEQAWQDAIAYKSTEDATNADLMAKMTNAHQLHELYVAYRQDDAAAWATWGLIAAELFNIDDQRNAPLHLGHARARMEESLRRPQVSLSEEGVKRMDEARRWLVGLYMARQEYGDALDHLEFLVKENDGDAELKRLQAECQIGMQQFDKAGDALRKLIEDDPTQVAAYYRLATLLKDRMEKPAEAEEVIQAAVTANPDSFEVYLFRAGYHRAADRLDEAKQDILTALSFPDGAEDVRVIITAAEIAMAAEDFAMAREQLLRGVQLHPQSEMIYLNLYNLAVAENDRDTAIQQLEQGMEQIPQSAMLRTRYADQMQQIGKLDVARDHLNRLREMRNVPRGDIPYLEGRVAMQERNWIEARKKLNDARRHVSNMMVRQIDMDLAVCHQQLGQHGAALGVYERLLATDPDMVEAHLGRARVLYLMKRWSESLREYKAVVSTLGMEKFNERFADGVRLVELAEKVGDSAFYDQVTLHTTTDESGGLTSLMTNIQMLLNQKRTDDARQLLEDYLAKNADAERAWLVLAGISNSTGTIEDALAVLDRAEQALGERPSTRLARIRFVSALPEEEAKPRLDALAQRAEQLDPQDREAALDTLADAYLRLGEAERAIKYWEAVVELRPQDPKLLMTLLEVQLARGDDEQIQKAMDRIRSRLGNSSEYTHFAEAARLISKVRIDPNDKKLLSQADRERLADANRFIQLAKRERPNWHDAARLEGGVAELLGDVDKAIDRYQEAVNHGERSPRVLQRLVALLYSAQRVEEIQGIITLLRESPGSEAFIEGWESLLTGSRDYDKIIENLRLRIEDDPRNPTRHFELAQMLVLSGQLDEAEQALRKVVELNDGTNDLAYTALVQLLLHRDKLDEAKAVTANAKLQLPPERSAKVLARCYELLGEFDQAEQTYLADYTGNPSDLAALRSLATFHIRRAQEDKQNMAEHLAKADARVNELIAKGDAVSDEDGDHVRWARRAMADRLAGTISMLTQGERSYADFKLALELIDANTAEGEAPSVMDRLTKAMVMAMRPEKAHRREAIAQFEAIREEQQLRPAQLYTLASLYERVGRWDDCRRTMAELLNRNSEPRYLSQMIHMILRNDNPRDDGTASAYLVQLKEQAPDSHETAIAEARYLIATKRERDGIERMQRLIPRPPRPDKPEDILILRDVALYLEQMEQIDAAKDLWREYVAARPDATLGLAAFLGRHGQLDEAYDLCDEQLARNSSLIGSVIQVGLNSIRMQKTSLTPVVEDRHFDRVDKWFEQGMQTYPSSYTLKLQRAELYDIHGRYDDAEKMYRTLAIDAAAPEQYRAVARNNLAFMMALRYENDAAGQRALREAEKMIGDAIAVRGMTADLLDTRGMVHLALENTDQAIKDLQVSIDDSPSGLKLFHLALAYEQAEDRDMAALTLKRAFEDYGLEAETVVPLERPKYKALLARLEME